MRFATMPSPSEPLFNGPLHSTYRACFVNTLSARGGTRVLPAELTRGFLGMLSRAVWRSGLVGLFLAVFFHRRFHRFQNVGRIVFVVKKLVLLPASIDAQIELA